MVVAVVDGDTLPGTVVAVGVVLTGALTGWLLGIVEAVGCGFGALTTGLPCCTGALIGWLGITVDCTGALTGWLLGMVEAVGCGFGALTTGLPCSIGAVGACTVPPD